jgi:ABC-type nickel/cobalt efflux system permease component RcnA
MRPLSRAQRPLVVSALSLLLLIAMSLPAAAETKPPSAFGSPQSAQGAPPSAFSTPQAAPGVAEGPFRSLMNWVTATQQSMQKELAASVKRLKSGNAMAAALALAGLSFLYGVVHAVGPGHGKAIISSYVVANEERVKRGIAISFLAAAMQAVTAVVLVSVLLIALNTTGLQLNAWANQLESASYALIALVGLYLLLTQLVRLWRRYREKREDSGTYAARGNPGHHHDHDHDHAHGHHHHAHHHAEGETCDECGHMVDARQLAGPFSWRKAMAVVFSVGIRPCTGAILVLVFALTQGLFWAGVAATFAMALGTAITVAVLASLALGSRELALKLGGTNAAWADAVWTACAIGGALVILLFGSLLFIASLGPARPF